jgi:hypothetical protein
MKRELEVCEQIEVARFKASDTRQDGNLDVEPTRFDLFRLAGARGLARRLDSIQCRNQTTRVPAANYL